ncbi:CHAP domain-containing protein [Brachybacterium kimchii]|uniref:CHAP domain-containing protein n=1 Tax=Brachybacterium kimchii TaxID=2942909 RepID=A0ABY4N215_9MICO|nr:CHAP domain-containing protein [Brachybacterium kimchii]UQN28605.1 CHAP domain-containing protein [Brachybacterium kimchii]
MDARCTAKPTRRHLLMGLGVTALAGVGVTALPATRASAEPVHGTSNPGLSGQCTEGAAQKFREQYGYFPALTGNAAQWDDAAGAAGLSVSADAKVHAIVVFEAGVQGADPNYGHVAWVDAVDDAGVHITEMNGPPELGGGVGVFDSRVVQDLPGMSYIHP